MTLRDPLEREPVEIDPRRMTPARRARILKRDHHACRYPGCGVNVGLEIDHIIPLELGGKDRDENLETLCSEHHKAKTRRDIKLIAKARRQKAKNDGTFPESRARMKGRGFQKTRPWP